MKILFHATFFFLLVTQICFAQPVSPSASQEGWFWQNPLPQGNILNSVKFISSDVGWAVGRGGIIIKTTDGGTNWTIQSNQTGYTLYSVYFTDENNGWAVGTMVTWIDSLWDHFPFGIILNTTNGGTTWTEQISLTYQNLYGVSFADANNGWVVGQEMDLNTYRYRGLILHTTNGGATWNRQASGTADLLFSVCFTDANNGWIVGQIDTIYSNAVVLKTTDGGTNWTQTNLLNIGLSSVCFTDTNNGWAIGTTSYNGVILRTTNGGTTWTQQTFGTRYSFMEVSFSDVNNGWVVGFYFISGSAYTYGIILRTTNGGTTWVTQRSGIKGEIFNDISSSNANNGTVVGGGNVGTSFSTIILRTTNGGTNWNSQISGTTTAELHDVFFADEKNGWAVGRETIYNSAVILKTTNGGTSWTEQIGVGGNAVFFIDVNNGWVVAPYDLGCKIFHTTNGGTTWTLQTLSQDGYFYDITFSDENNGWVVGLWGYRTTDGGNTWIPGVPAGYAICFTDAKNGWVVGDQGKIFRTTNGGTDWIQQTSGTTEPLLDVSFTDVNNGWAVGTIVIWKDSLYIQCGLILHTTNGGTTWTSSHTSGTHEGLQSVCFTDADNGWVGGGGGIVNLYGLILHTTDGGINWTRQESGTTNWLASIYFTDESNGWAVGECSTILHTTNGGVTFIEEEAIDEIPTEFLLSNNYPNPFNPSTSIQYAISSRQFVSLKVYDVLGNEIETLVKEEKSIGTYEVTWYAENLPSGVYFYQLQAGDYINTKKMILLK